jgi:hypothetical protein
MTKIDINILVSDMHYLPAAHSANQQTRRSAAILAAATATDFRAGADSQNIVRSFLAHVGGSLRESDDRRVKSIECKARGLYSKIYETKMNYLMANCCLIAYN